MSQTGPWGMPGNPGYPGQMPPPGHPWQGSRPNWQAPGPGPYQGAYPQMTQPVQAAWGRPAMVVPTAKKSSAMPIIAVVVIALIIVIAVIVLAKDNEPARDTPTYTPPASSTKDPGTESTKDPGPESSEQTPDPPPPPPTDAPADPGQYTPGPPDLNPGDAPRPLTYPELYEALERNPLYQQTMPVVDCSVEGLAWTEASASAMENHLNNFVECLMFAWHPPLFQAGFSLPRPSVTVYTQPTRTPCGDVPMKNAFYCPADQQIYFAQDMITNYGSSISRFTPEATVAHEFGHAIQNRTMILYSGSVLQYEAETQDQAWDASRRTELQADCFAGLFLASVTQSAQITDEEREAALAFRRRAGSEGPREGDHGMGANRAMWMERGWSSSSAGTCNTWLADDDLVS